MIQAKEMPNPFEKPSLVEGYERWYAEEGQRADRLEKLLLGKLMDWINGCRTLLDVGSGTGHFARFFNRTGMRVVGADISWPMIREAIRLGTPPSVLGDACHLPFDDRAFDVVMLVATLEFVSSPILTLREAQRVSRRGLLIGAVNRASPFGLRTRSTTREPWAAANLPTVRELRRFISASCEKREYSVTWSTTLWPGYSKALPLPWGRFIGMAVRWDDTNPSADTRELPQ